MYVLDSRQNGPHLPLKSFITAKHGVFRPIRQIRSIRINLIFKKISTGTPANFTFVSTPHHMVRMHSVQYPFSQNGQNRGRRPPPKYRIVSCHKTPLNTSVATHAYTISVNHHRLLPTHPNLP